LNNASDDNIHETMLEIGREHEVRYLREEIARLEHELALTDEAIGKASGEELSRLLDNAAALRREIARLRKELSSIDKEGLPPN
jgi:hypothetical protein